MSEMTTRRRRSRPDGTGAQKMLQGRVPKDVHSLAHERANKANLSLALYLEELVLRDEVDATGRPVWAAATQQEALDISA